MTSKEHYHRLRSAYSDKYSGSQFAAVRFDVDHLRYVRMQ